jgi:glycosyltransferase involved in cell wall biosynthesis
MPFLKDHLRTARGKIRYLPARLARPASNATARVFYGHRRIPALDQLSQGGMVKIQRLHHQFPNSPIRFNLLYLVSSMLPPDWTELLRFVHGRRAKLIWNQNGVGYPAWHGPGWERVNEPMRVLLHCADLVIYQSKFCKISADRYLGERRAPSRVIYNAVDTRAFTPLTPTHRSGPWVALTTGSINQVYRFKAAVETISVARARGLDIDLLVAGRLAWGRDRNRCTREALELLDRLDLREHVTLLPAYSQLEAPELYRRAHIFLHTQYNDACPTTVIESMASGLPVVFSESGGVPELVGEDAGIAVPVPLDWEKTHVADPGAMADALSAVLDDWRQYSNAARHAAVSRFDIRDWLAAHEKLFDQVMSGE